VRARLEEERLIQQDAELQAAAEAEADRIMQVEAEQEFADQAELQAHPDFLAQQADAEEAAFAQLVAEDSSEANDALETDHADWVSEGDADAAAEAYYTLLLDQMNDEAEMERDISTDEQLQDAALPMHEQPQLQAEQWCAQADAELRAIVALLDSQGDFDTALMRVDLALQDEALEADRAHADQWLVHADAELRATAALSDSQGDSDTEQMQIHRAGTNQRAAHADSDLYAAVQGSIIKMMMARIGK
jgi:hypothetical protein